MTWSPSSKAVAPWGSPISRSASASRGNPASHARASPYCAYVSGPVSWIVVGAASVVFVLMPTLLPALVLVGGGAIYVAAYFLGLTAI